MPDLIPSAPFDLVALAPHPDDAEIGCAGALIQAVAAGLRVAIVDLTRGEASTRGTPTQRESERQSATKLLRLTDRFYLDLPDGGITSDPAQRRQLAALLRQLRPHIVLAPFVEDRHPDHAAAGRLAREACFAAGLVGEDGLPPFRPFRLFHYMIHHPFEPRFILDISREWPSKLAAIRAYASQFEGGRDSSTALAGPHFLRMLEARAIHFGSMIGASHGEPFYGLGPLGFLQMPGLDRERTAPGDLPPYNPFGS